MFSRLSSCSDCEISFTTSTRRKRAKSPVLVFCLLKPTFLSEGVENGARSPQESVLRDLTASVTERSNTCSAAQEPCFGAATGGCTDHSGVMEGLISLSVIISLFLYECFSSLSGFEWCPDYMLYYTHTASVLLCKHDRPVA